MKEDQSDATTPPVVAPASSPIRPLPTSVGSSTGSEDTAETDRADEDGFHKAYEEHSRVLRTWLVAYGIAAPVLFLTNERLSQLFVASTRAPTIAKAFLAGVVLQVVLAAVNKTAMWACYYASRHPHRAEEPRYRFAFWLGEQFWIDFVVDVITLGVFGWATWQGLQIVFQAT